MINEWKLKEQFCEIGQRIWQRGFVAANDGNMSYRIADNRVLCSPTMVSKGFMKPSDICTVDLEGNQVAGTKKRTSEILLHLEIMKHRPDVKSVIHTHPPHATAFAVAGIEVPNCVLPEVEVFLGQVPTAEYETPGGKDFAKTIIPVLKEDTNTVLLRSHGIVTFGKDLEDAYYKTEIIEAYCRILMLTKQLGGALPISQEKVMELIDLKTRLGFKDTRSELDLENCDLCGNIELGRGYVQPACACANGTGATDSATVTDVQFEDMVTNITDQVMGQLAGT